MSNATPIVTDHAFERGKQRLGLGVAAMQRTAEIALRDGFRHADFSGPFKRFLDAEFLKERAADNIRVHGEQVFIFQGKKLITVFRVRSEFLRPLAKMRARRAPVVDRRQARRIAP